DLTAVFLSLAGISVVFRVIKTPELQKEITVPLILFIFLFVTILSSLLYTESIVLSGDKLLKFTLLTVPSFVFPLFLIRSKESLTRFLFTIAAVAFALSIFSIPMILERGSNVGFVGFNDGNYLGLSRATGTGLIILVFLGLLNPKFTKMKLPFLL